MSKFIDSELETSSDESDEEVSDEETSDKEQIKTKYHDDFQFGGSVRTLQAAFKDCLMLVMLLYQ